MNKKTFMDTGPSPKMCFMYCGDDICNCRCSPKYRDQWTSEMDLAAFKQQIQDIADKANIPQDKTVEE